MIPGVPQGVTRVLGKSQGYNGLPIRDEFAECTVAGVQPVMTSVWQPTPEELAALNAGASVQVTIAGAQHPPILVGVGAPPKPEETN